MLSVPVAFNGSELYVAVAEKPGGLRVGFDADEWRGLRLYRGQRVPVRRGEAEEWLYVAEVAEMPPTCWVEFRRRYDGPVVEPAPRPRREGRAAAPEEVRYDGHIIRFPEPATVAAAGGNAAAAAAPILRFPGPAEDTPPPAAVLAIDRGGAHAGLLKAGAEWLRVYKPHSRYAVFLNDEGDDAPMGRVTIRPTCDASA